MPQSQKLSKKQKKGIAFRERKGKKKEENIDVTDIPIPEIQEDLDDVPSLKEDLSAGKKRRRLSQDDGEKPKKAKKVKINDEGIKSDELVTEAPDKDHTNDAPPTKAKQKRPPRYILFAGNLSYTTTKEAILAHFAVCPEPPTVRLLTQRPRPGSTSSITKTKGCAFLEFKSSLSLQIALKMHHSELSGRRINVELTAGGGGASEKRREKLKEKNAALELERKKRGASNPSAAQSTSLPERHSTTSGVGSVPEAPKTWTIGPREKSRGKRKGKPGNAKAWASGANAVSIG